MTSVVAVAVPLLTAAPWTGAPFWSTTLPCRLAVTVILAGILLGLLLVAVLLLLILLLQAIKITSETSSRDNDRVKSVFFKGYWLGYPLKTNCHRQNYSDAGETSTFFISFNLYITSVTLLLGMARII